MTVHSKLDEWYEGKSLTISTSGDRKTYSLFVGKDGKIVARLSVELYEESTYDDYIEVPKKKIRERPREMG